MPRLTRSQVGLTFDEAMGAPTDASLAVTAGEFRAAPGSCHFLNVVVLMAEGRNVAIVCEQHQDWVKSPANHVVKSTEESTSPRNSLTTLPSRLLGSSSIFSSSPCLLYLSMMACVA